MDKSHERLVTWHCIFVDKHIEGITWAQGNGRNQSGIETKKSDKNDDNNNNFLLNIALNVTARVDVRKYHIYDRIGIIGYYIEIES